jgi:hypothetical protein
MTLPDKGSYQVRSDPFGPLPDTAMCERLGGRVWLDSLSHRAKGSSKSSSSPLTRARAYARMPEPMRPPVGRYPAAAVPSIPVRELMSHEIAVVVSLGSAALIVAGLAAYFAWLSRCQRSRATHWQKQVAARDEALHGLVAQGLGSVASSVQVPQPAVAEFDVSDRLAGSGFVNDLRVLAERYVADLQRVQSETVAATRRQAEDEAREAAGAAVKSFATAMVSVGIDVSSEIAQALRQYHGSAVFMTLTKVDHGVQQMLHQAQSYVVLGGGLLGQRWPANTLTEVVGAAQGAIRDYTRVQPYASASDRAVISRMVGPVRLILSHLLDNAARYSPPQACTPRPEPCPVPRRAMTGRMPRPRRSQR